MSGVCIFTNSSLGASHLSLNVLAALECLFWGQYFSSHVGSSSTKKGLHMVTQKWNHTLQQLDVANQLFSEDDLETAVFHLAQANDADTLRSLNLSGTRITPPALRCPPVVSHQSIVYMSENYVSSLIL